MPIQLSPIVPGVWKWGAWGKNALTIDDRLRLIEGCIDCGATTFDHADIYGGYEEEEKFGQAIARKPGLRHEMQLVTKCGIRMLSENRPEIRYRHYDTSRKHILQSVDHSLKNLHSDYLDLLLIHRPDPLMKTDEIAEAFSLLRQNGKVLHFGVSNFTPFQFELIYSRFPIEVNQVEISILRQEPFMDGTLDQCQKLGILPMAWSPLGSGKIFSDQPDERIASIQNKAREIGARYDGKSMDQVLLAWLLRHPARIVPVLGTTRLERVQAAMEATHFQLSREEWHELWDASAGKALP